MIKKKKSVVVKVHKPTKEMQEMIKSRHARRREMMKESK